MPAQQGYKILKWYLCQMKWAWRFFGNFGLKINCWTRSTKLYSDAFKSGDTTLSAIGPSPKLNNKYILPILQGKPACLHDSHHEIETRSRSTQNQASNCCTLQCHSLNFLAMNWVIIVNKLWNSQHFLNHNLRCNYTFVPQTLHLWWVRRPSFNIAVCTIMSPII